MLIYLPAIAVTVTLIYRLVILTVVIHIARPTSKVDMERLEFAAHVLRAPRHPGAIGKGATDEHGSLDAS